LGLTDAGVDRDRQPVAAHEQHSRAGYRRRRCACKTSSRRASFGCAGRTADISGPPGSLRLTKIPSAALVTAARSGGFGAAATAARCRPGSSGRHSLVLLSAAGEWSEAPAYTQRTRACFHAALKDGGGERGTSRILRYVWSAATTGERSGDCRVHREEAACPTVTRCRTGARSFTQPRAFQLEEMSTVAFASISLNPRLLRSNTGMVLI
jgi:hypothetical protein